MSKKIRQNALIELIGKTKVRRQDELASLLNEKGFLVTQASISRDIADLGIIKVGGIYQTPAADKLRKGDHLILSPAGDNLLVAQCQPGMASSLAVRIDSANISEVVGTIAGDDTIFIACRNKKERDIADKKIRTVVEDKMI